MSQKEDELARRVDAALASWRRGVQALERRWDAEGEDPDAEETVAVAVGIEPELAEGRGDEPKARASKANMVKATASGGTRPKRARPSSGWASSYAGFVQRAQTFSAFSWFGKPEAIGRDVCAAHGWTNVDTDKLACASCKRELFFQEIEDSVRERGGDFQAAVREFRNAIERGHERLCPFAFSFVSRDLAQALLRRKKHREDTSGASRNGIAQNLDHDCDAAERAEAMLARQMRLLAECKSETSAHAAHLGTRKASLHSVP